MPDKKKYKVAIFITSSDNYIDINGNIDGTLPRIWNYIKKELNHKYSFEEKIIYSNKIDFVNFLNKVNSEFDILIANYWILPERKKIVDFTDTILYNSATILYDKNIENQLDIYVFLKEMIKVWFYPILAFFSFGINAGLNYLLIPEYKEVGAAFASFIGLFLYSLILQLMAMKYHQSKKYKIVIMLIYPLVILCVYLHFRGMI